MSGVLRMVRMRLSLPGLFRLGRARGLPNRGADLGYLAHCELKGLFGDAAPGPFRLDEARGRWLTVHAYTARPKEDLLEHARAFADPLVAEAWDAESLAEKELPATWQVGRRIGFEVRCCPVVRLSKELKLPADGKREATIVSAGSEIDAFLARAWRSPEPLDRETVYRDWLDAEVVRRGGLAGATVRITAMKRAALLRRAHGPDRRSRFGERPDVTFLTTAEIVEPAAFAGLLARGLGRHRAFGFGMVVLRPLSEAC